MAGQLPCRRLADDRPGRGQSRQSFGVLAAATTFIGYDYLSSKYDTNGVEQWRSYSDGVAHANDVGNSLAVDGSGNVYVTGRSGNGANDDYLTIVRADGAELRRATVNGPASGNDGQRRWPWTQAATSMSRARPTPGTNDAFLTIKYDTNGIELWRLQSGGPTVDVAVRHRARPGNSVYVAGQGINMAGLFGMMVQKIVEPPITDRQAATSSLNPSVTSQNVTFAVTVTGDGPSGTVDLRDGAADFARACHWPAEGGGAIDCRVRW